MIIFMNERICFSISVLFLSLLQACGGGSGGEASPEAPAAEAEKLAAEDMGSVAARFAAGENTRIILLSSGVQSFGAGNPAEQIESGAMVRLASASLSGTRQTVDISGDEHFALGRWLRGTVSTSSGDYTLDGKDPRSFHYIAYNRLAELPVKGQLQCSAVAATAPTALSGTQEKLGSATGSATVSFDANGAATQGTMQVRVGAETVSVSLATTIVSPTALSITGHMLANGPGAAVVLAGQGGEVPALVVGYKAQVSNGSYYTGVARFACTAS